MQSLLKNKSLLSHILDKHTLQSELNNDLQIISNNYFMQCHLVLDAF